MPREHKKRGKRGASENKRSRDETDDADDTFKRRRTIEPTDHAEGYVEVGEDFAGDDSQHLPNGLEKRFYGLLDDHEQEYFKKADEMVEVNQFGNTDERSIFIANVHKEASGKELKLACSQGTSRLMERLIILSTAAQLKVVFQRFQGEFLQLMSHRFASHCCETLFTRAAPIVSEELASELKRSSEISVEDPPSMESLFVDLAYELEHNLGYMITDKYASHALRVLLVIYSGASFGSLQQKSLLAGKHKEHIGVAMSPKTFDPVLSERPIPPSFLDTLQYLIEHSVAGLDSNAVRSLATHKTGNPVLQLLLRLELTSLGKQRSHDANSIIRKLIPDETIEEGTDSASFINGMLFDPVGSHLLETLIQNGSGKLFKSLYKHIFKDRLGSLARNSVASYVVCRVLERLSGQDLGAAANALIPEVPILAQRDRTNVLQTLAERLTIRGLDAEPFAKALKSAYGTDGNENTFIQRLLQLPDELRGLLDITRPEAATNLQTTSVQNAASFFAQALLKMPGPLSSLMFDSLSNIESPLVKHIALTPTLSPILQVALTADTASTKFRRKLITHLYGSIASLSTSTSGSHVIDAIEVGSRKNLAFVRERVAEELAESEALMRDSFSGRKVWKNWNMDLYQRDRSRWVRNTRKKVGNNGFQSLPGLLGESDMAAQEKGMGPVGRIQTAVADATSETKHSATKAIHESLCEPVRETGKTALDRARERYARSQRPSSRVGSKDSKEADIT